MKRLAQFSFYLFLVLAAGQSVAQSPIPGVAVLTPQLNTPSAFLSDWQSRASTATVIITNTGAAFDGKIWVEFFLNGDKVAFSQPNKLPFTRIPTGSTPFNGETLVPLSSVHFESNVDQASQRSGRIPNGQICIRVNVLDPKTGNQSASPLGCSVIISFFPPQLLLPANNVSLCKVGQNNVIFTKDGQPLPMFQWTPIAPAPTTPVKYHFAIFEIYPNQEPIASIRGNRPVFDQDVLGLNSLLWPHQYFLPEPGKSYIWSVRALDERGQPFIQSNDGWAEPFRFSVLRDCDQVNSQNQTTDQSLLMLDGKPAATIQDYSPKDPESNTEISLNVFPTSEGIYSWIENSWKSNYMRKSGEIHVADFNRKARHIREFKDALLTGVTFPACDGGAKDPAFMTLKFSPWIVRNRPGDGSRIDSPIDMQQKQWHPSDFRFTIDGMEKSCARVTKIDAFTIKQKNAAFPKVELQMMKLTIPEEDVREFVKWYEDFVINGNNQEAKHKTGSLSYLNRTRQKELLTLTLSGLGIFKITHEKDQAIIELSVEDVAIVSPRSRARNTSMGAAGKVLRVKISSSDIMQLTLADPAVTAGNVHFNPKEITVDKSVPWQRHRKTEGDEPTLEFTASEPKNMNVELLFDTYEQKTDVRKGLLDSLIKFLAIDTPEKRPPMVTFTWGSTHSVFHGVVDNISVKYTMFSPSGTPTRATCTVHLREGSPSDSHSSDQDQKSDEDTSDPKK